MSKSHINSELYEILHFTPEISSEVQDKVNNAYDQIRSGKIQVNKKKKILKILYPGVAAAIIILLGFLGFSNPALAGKIPFIGRIFRTIESNIGYSGNYSEHATVITAPENILENNNDSQANMATNNDSENKINSDSDTNAYSQASGDITITLSEVVCTDMSLYISLEIYNEEGFPEELNLLKNMDTYTLTYNFLFPISSNTFDFSTNEEFPPPEVIEGDYADAHTFLGVIRLDMDRIRDIAGLDTLPDEFTYSINISGFWGIMNEIKEYQTTHEITGETTTIQSRDRKLYNGLWCFTIPVVLDRSDTQVKEIMETNEDGIGIARVTKTLYEMKAELILPDTLPNGKEPCDYHIVITDADGKILDSQGNIMEIYSLYGRNTDTVHIYVVDNMTSWDKGSENSLPEKALFQTTVAW